MTGTGTTTSQGEQPNHVNFCCQSSKGSKYQPFGFSGQSNVAAIQEGTAYLGNPTRSLDGVYKPSTSPDMPTAASPWLISIQPYG